MNWSRQVADTYWLKQASDKPLFSEIIWNRPEHKAKRGKLLIIGGNQYFFAGVASAYSGALAAGAGSVRVILPDKLERTLGKSPLAASFAPSTPSGSFARKGLAELLDQAGWADAVYLAGDFGRNSETAILLESFASKYTRPLALYGDSLDYFETDSGKLLGRPNILAIATIAQLQKMLAPEAVIKHDMELVQFINLLAEFHAAATILTLHQDHLVVASGGRISTTPADNRQLGDVAAAAVVWQMQQPDKVFEAVTSAVYK